MVRITAIMLNAAFIRTRITGVMDKSAVFRYPRRFFVIPEKKIEEADIRLPAVRGLMAMHVK